MPAVETHSRRERFLPHLHRCASHALGIARRYHSNVSLLHVIDPSIYGLAGPDGISADTENAQRDAERIEDGLRGDGSLEGLKFDITVSVGPVWRAMRGL